MNLAESDTYYDFAVESILEILCQSPVSNEKQ